MGPICQSVLESVDAYLWAPPKPVIVPFPELFCNTGLKLKKHIYCAKQLYNFVIELQGICPNAWYKNDKSVQAFEIQKFGHTSSFK